MKPSNKVRLRKRPSVAAGPWWDVSGPCLYLDGRPIKKFRKRMGWQAALLTAFEVLGWPTGPITDPLAPEVGDTADDRRRLHNVVDYLNRQLPPGTIRFWTDGIRVGWCPPAAG